ncbi:pali-domain-containing protein [Cutaneotrichosporon oleaginosum]|uniref:Pali-domain-containing protein n=1 Tax=Cutaneotrichosporon oleaginosum TaxID=879819 RepID=A0A0J0XUK4_9TREE|nr:pali-domain-containing protein [Cutaneotrichosporon oleaginosum]KLT44786.1 pali-domain-containing protein [Cutaneotrichosporon oleaginosum]TXT11926.1 hypothetical protein COLE_02336 [Cutaneotrichosporon oleaginosum]
MIIGGFTGLLLLVACVLLILASVSTPIINSLTLMTVHEPVFAQIGAFGYCLQNTCSGTKLGYDLTGLTNRLSLGQSTQGTGVIDGVSDSAAKSLTAVTKGLILHPIAAAFAFLAMITACAADKIGYLFASLLALLAFLSALAAMLIDFVAFAMVKNNIGDAGGRANYGTGTWLTLVATILLLIAMLTSLVSCCCGRSNKHKQRERELRAEQDALHYNEKPRRFWQRGPRHTAAHTAPYDPNAPNAVGVPPRRHFWSRGPKATTMHNERVV